MRRSSFFLCLLSLFPAHSIILIRDTEFSNEFTDNISKLMPFIKKELDFNGYYVYGVILQGLSKFYKANGIFFSSKYYFVLCGDVLKPVSDILPVVDGKNMVIAV